MNSKESYKLYLKTEHWKETRKKRLVLDDFCCIFCKSKKSLQVHHLNYKRVGKENIVEDLITVCKFCHERIHNKKHNKKIKKQKKSKSKVKFKKIKGICKFVEEERNKFKPVEFLIKF
jgi:5-methylcytosine-specific restriction endonuclease McrA